MKPLETLEPEIHDIGVTELETRRNNENQPTSIISESRSKSNMDRINDQEDELLAALAKVVSV